MLGHGVRNMRGETQAIAIWICDNHFSGTPRRILRSLGWLNAASTEKAKALINVGHNEIGGPTCLAVSGVLGEEDGLALPGELQKEGEARLELMLPIDSKAKALHIERQAIRCTGNPKLRYDCLAHDVLSLPHNAGIKRRRSGPLE